MPSTLTDRELKLLRVLFEHAKPVTGKELASIVGVSERTVRSYVQAINRAAGTTCIASGRYGYTCDHESSRDLLHTDNNRSGAGTIPQTSEERCTWLIGRLLRSKHALNIYDLCEEVFVSISTMKNELIKVRRRFARYDLELEQANSMLIVHGTEKSKRRMLSDLLYKEASVNFLDLETIQRAFPDIDVTFVKTCVVEVLDAHRYFVNDYSLINLVLHIAIAIDRIRNNNSSLRVATEDSVPEPQDGGSELSGSEGHPNDLRAHEYAMAREVAQQLAARFNVLFSPTECDELALLLASRTTLLNYESETRESIAEYVGADCLHLVDRLIGDIEAFYYINLSEQEFFTRFALHIKNLLVRAEHDAFAKNPLTQEIRTSCPLLYDAAVSQAGIIKQETGMRITDDEIAYIAFHLGSTIEAQKQLSSKVKAVLYTPMSYYTDKQLRSFIDRQFKDDILVVDVIADEAHLHHVEATELIIATAPINAILDVPVCQIGMVPRAEDTEHIRELVSNIQHAKRRAEFRDHLEELMLPEFFEADAPLASRQEIIEHMSARLEQANFVDIGYADEIWEREYLSSTAFGTVAIPHTLKPHAKRSCISVLIPRRPIDWDGTTVTLVIMLCFSVRQRATFNALFDPLAQILIDERNVTSLAAVHDHRTFVEALSSMLA